VDPLRNNKSIPRNFKDAVLGVTNKIDDLKKWIRARLFQKENWEGESSRPTLWQLYVAVNPLGVQNT